MTDATFSIHHNLGWSLFDLDGFSVWRVEVDAGARGRHVELGIVVRRSDRELVGPNLSNSDNNNT